MIEDAYRAASGEIGWQAFLDHFSAIPAVRAVLMGHSQYCTEIHGCLHVNWDPTYISSFVDHYAAINMWLPAMKRMPHMPNGGWAHEMMDLDSAKHTEFYNDWVKPQDDCITGYAVYLDVGEDQTISLNTNIPFAHIEECRRLERIVLDILPHLRRALELQRQLRGQKLLAASYEQTLDQLHNAVVLTDSRRRVLFANEKAETLLRAGSLIRRGPDGRLQFTRSEDEKSVARDFALDRPGFPKLAPFTIPLLPGANNAPSLLLFVSPLGGQPSEARDTLTFRQAPRHFAWFFIDPDAAPQPQAEVVAAVLRVSPAEAALALSVLQDKSLAEHAVERGISVHTARRQMQSLLTKTECNRQSELAARLNRLFALLRM